jgi:hypothetical protein
VAQPLTLRQSNASPSDNIISGSTPLSKIGAPLSMPDPAAPQSPAGVGQPSKFCDLIAAAYGFTDKDEEASESAGSGSG